MDEKYVDNFGNELDMEDMFCSFLPDEILDLPEDEFDEASDKYWDDMLTEAWLNI